MRSTIKVLVSAAVMLGMGLQNFATPVHASSKFEVTKIDDDLGKEKQIHIRGTVKQLQNVEARTMKFIKDIAADANRSALANDLYASITIAQAILESNSGTHAHGHNLFGIKGSYKGKSALLRTYEDDGTGKWHRTKAYFKVYPSYREAIEDHDYLLKHGLNGFYSGTWKSKTESYKQAARFLQGRYATDTSYASKLISIIETYNLTRFDNPLSNRDMAWLQSDSIDPFELPIVETNNYEMTWAVVSLSIPDEYKDKVASYSVDGFVDEETLLDDVSYINSRLSAYNETKRLIGGYLKSYRRAKGELGNHSVIVVTETMSDNEVVERLAFVEYVAEDGTILTSEYRDDIQSTVYKTIPQEFVKDITTLDLGEINTKAR